MKLIYLVFIRKLEEEDIEFATKTNRILSIDCLPEFANLIDESSIRRVSPPKPNEDFDFDLSSIQGEHESQMTIFWLENFEKSPLPDDDKLKKRSSQREEILRTGAKQSGFFLKPKFRMNSAIENDFKEEVKEIEKGGDATNKNPNIIRNITTSLKGESDFERFYKENNEELSLNSETKKTKLVIDSEQKINAFFNSKKNEINANKIANINENKEFPIQYKINIEKTVTSEQNIVSSLNLSKDSNKEELYTKINSVETKIKSIPSKEEQLPIHITTRKLQSPILKQEEGSNEKLKKKLQSPPFKEDQQLNEKSTNINKKIINIEILEKIDENKRKSQQIEVNTKLENLTVEKNEKFEENIELEKNKHKVKTNKNENTLNDSYETPFKEIASLSSQNKISEKSISSSRKELSTSIKKYEIISKEMNQTEKTSINKKIIDTPNKKNIPSSHIEINESSNKKSDEIDSEKNLDKNNEESLKQDRSSNLSKKNEKKLLNETKTNSSSHKKSDSSFNKTKVFQEDLIKKVVKDKEVLEISSKKYESSDKKISADKEILETPKKKMVGSDQKEKEVAQNLNNKNEGSDKKEFKDASAKKSELSDKKINKFKEATEISTKKIELSHKNTIENKEMIEISNIKSKGSDKKIIKDKDIIEIPTKKIEDYYGKSLKFKDMIEVSKPKAEESINDKEKNTDDSSKNSKLILSEKKITPMTKNKLLNRESETCENIREDFKTPKQKSIIESSSFNTEKERMENSQKYFKTPQKNSQLLDKKITNEKNNDDLFKKEDVSIENNEKFITESQIPIKINLNIKNSTSNKETENSAASQEISTNLQRIVSSKKKETLTRQENKIESSLKEDIKIPQTKITNTIHKKIDDNNFYFIKEKKINEKNIPLTKSNEKNIKTNPDENFLISTKTANRKKYINEDIIVPEKKNITAKSSIDKEKSSIEVKNSQKIQELVIQMKQEEKFLKCPDKNLSTIIITKNNENHNIKKEENLKNDIKNNNEEHKLKWEQLKNEELNVIKNKETLDNQKDNEFKSKKNHLKYISPTLEKKKDFFQMNPNFNESTNSSVRSPQKTILKTIIMDDEKNKQSNTFHHKLDIAKDQIIKKVIRFKDVTLNQKNSNEERNKFFTRDRKSIHHSVDPKVFFFSRVS